MSLLQDLCNAWASLLCLVTRAELVTGRIPSATAKLDTATPFAAPEQSFSTPSTSTALPFRCAKPDTPPPQRASGMAIPGIGASLTSFVQHQM